MLRPPITTFEGMFDRDIHWIPRSNHGMTGKKTKFGYVLE